jgi:DNA-binding NarL/FixJ family response regulator
MKHVLIVEDVKETREWLSDCICEAFPQSDTYKASDFRSGLYAIRHSGVDLAILDLGLPDGNGVDLITELKAKSPKAMIVVATVMGDDQSIISALSAGAQGYLLKDSPRELFIAQLQQHILGIPALSPSVARRIVEHFRQTAPELEKLDGLTARESEVLALIGKGFRNKEVAEKLDVSLPTVASHIKAIYAKLNVRNRAEAAILAQKLGLT